MSLPSALQSRCLAAAVLALAACGTNPPSNDKACTDLETAVCAKIDACSDTTGVSRRYGDSATCLLREKQACLLRLAAPQTTGSSSSFESCSAAYPTYTCADFLANNPPAACIAANGPRAAGMPCYANGQCQSGFCLLAPTAACGTCAAQPKAGDTCSGAGTCGRDLECLASNTCAAYVALAGACDKNHPCASGLSCVGPMGAGTCQAAGQTVGAACEPQHVAAPACDGNFGLYCQPIMKKCAAIQYVAAGQPCGVVAGAVVDCKGGGKCVLAGVSGTCVPPAADGSACDSAAGPPCIAPARCVPTAGGNAGTCQLVGTNCK